MSGHSSQSEGQKREKRRQYQDFDLADLVPTQDTTTTTIVGPQRASKPGTSFEINSADAQDVETPLSLESGVIHKNVMVEQEIEEPPKLPRFRDSLRDSLGIFSRGIGSHSGAEA